MQAWDIPRYSPTDASRIANLSVGRVNRWLRGYDFVSGDTVHHKDPVVKRQNDSRYASFLDLIDLLFVKRFLDYGFSLQRIRLALTEAQDLIAGHHFAQRSFVTNGHDIYLWVKDSDSKHLIQLFTGGQWVIQDFALLMAEQIDFDEQTGFAERWYPAGRNGKILLDPEVAFGAPTIVGTGVRTSNVFDFFEAEGGDVQKTASWLSINKTDVEAAIEFEESLAA